MLNGSYNGVMGMFTRKEVDMVYSGLAITPDRSQLMQFTQPFYQSGTWQGRICASNPGRGWL